MGSVAEGLKGMSRVEKLQWALSLKDAANDFYRQRNFKDAAQCYQDCLIGLDFGDNETDAEESRKKLQLPITLNLVHFILKLF